MVTRNRNHFAYIHSWRLSKIDQKLSKTIFKMFLAVVVLAVLFVSTDAYTKQTEAAKAKFEAAFHERCEKYPFVQEYFKKLENPGNRYLVFTYHENNFRNGGIGDRIGGMISAFAMAQRFNRTLIIRSENGFSDAFRPYHPDDILAKNPKYLWSKYNKWSGFKPLNDQISKLRADMEMEEVEELEYSLSHCVSDQEAGFTEAQTHECSMADGDVPQPVIQFRSNRAYLCRWDNRPEHKAFLEFKRVLLGPERLNEIIAEGSNKFITNNNFDPASDLFEVAGCMMRLMMWPTEELWSRADAEYQKYHQTLLDEYKSKGLLPSVPSKNRKVVAVEDEDDDVMDDDDEDEEEVSSKRKKKTKKTKKGKKSKKSKKGKKGKKSSKKSKKSKKSQKSRRSDDDEEDEEEAEEVGSMVPVAHNISSILDDDVYQIGLHLRCGDRHSYFKFKLHTDGYDRYACIVERPNVELRESSTEHEKSMYLNAGNPLTIGECAKSMYGEYSNQVAKDNRKKTRQYKESLKKAASAEVGLDGSFTDSLVAPTERSPLKSSMVYITSDNIIAAQQMNATVGHPHTYISPQGCHIEYDPSVECHMFTVTYWFMLSLSDILVTQTFGEFNAPTSSFSRYAGMYGLKRDPFRSGRYCHERFNSAIISHMEQSNWFC